VATGGGPGDDRSNRIPYDGADGDASGTNRCAGPDVCDAAHENFNVVRRRANENIGWINPRGTTKGWVRMEARPLVRLARARPVAWIAMHLEDIIAIDSVILHMKASSKKEALQELARTASEILGLERREVFDVLLERERLGTTGIGGGIAIPHGKLASLDRLYGVFARADRAIDFDSIDDRPVDLIFLLLAPESAGADHLKALARVSRLLRDPRICEKLRGCDTKDAIFALLTQSTSRNAA
jgi:PTS system nitrogen regulatory IIA component